MIYPTLKLLHIMSATILFGGGIFAALLGTIVFGSKKAKVIAEVGPHIVKVESVLDYIVRACSNHHWIVDGIDRGISGFDGMAWVGLATILYRRSLLDPWCLVSIAWLIFPGAPLRQTRNYPLSIKKLFKNLTFLAPPLNDSHDWDFSFDGIQ